MTGNERLRVPIILGSPRVGSFCHAIAGTIERTLAAAEHDPSLHDLQAERFDPVATADEAVSRTSPDPLVEAHCRALAAADALVVVHPVWWGGPPAILKGWVDRVVRPGVAYEIGPVEPGGPPRHTRLLHVETLLVVTTSDTPDAVERERFGDPVGALWERYVAALCQIPHYERVALGVMMTSTADERAEWLAHAARRASALFAPRGRVQA